jgi:hypothetical protein
MRPRLLVAFLFVYGTLLSTCVAIEPEGSPDVMDVPASNQEMIEEQQEEVRDESNR